ncbi:MAG: glutaminase domain-containing protein [Fimbriimonadales bacterium]
MLALAAIALMTQDFRPPATPLVTHTPYFSIWSMGDRLTDDWPRHWTGAVNAMCGMIRIDGKVFRFMGPGPVGAPPMEQLSLRVLPTRTVYRFAAAGIELEVEFLSPLLAQDVALASRPVTFVTFTSVAQDRHRHDLSIYFDITAEACVNTPDQKVLGEQHRFREMEIASIRADKQDVLGRSGDDVRIDWGSLILTAPGADLTVGGAHVTRTAFLKGEPAQAGLGFPRAADDDWPCLSAAMPLEVGRRTPAHISLAYDEGFSAEYMGRRLRPWWRREFSSTEELLAASETGYATIRTRAADHDVKLVRRLQNRGGKEYAEFAALAYRQCMAAHCIVDGEGKPFMFSKENFSNGCIGTVDVTYPGSPFFLVFAPDLLEAQLEPVMLYAESARWKFPFAPHDLGTYPLANGQVYGGGEKTEDNQMPVEECGNMLIMAAALCKAQKSLAFAKRHWRVLTQWANYLRQKGLDPENQLCTDDFAGHLAHNANLSLKAILAIGAYAQLCEMRGESDAAKEWRAAARSMADEWQRLADDGGHFRLAFDKPGTWSQKYNLVWDEILGLNLFPGTVRQREVAHYLRVQNQFGLPLDSRKDYTKLDWVVWSACLAKKHGDFDKLIRPLHKWAQSTRDRVPLTDWFDTKTGKCVGFRARSVVGGVFIPLLGKL